MLQIYINQIKEDYHYSDIANDNLFSSKIRFNDINTPYSDYRSTDEENKWCQWFILDRSREFPIGLVILTLQFCDFTMIGESTFHINISCSSEIGGYTIKEFEFNYDGIIVKLK